MHWGELEKMKTDRKIILPQELQQEMIKFFLETSIPRKKKEKRNLLSKEIDRSDKK